MSTHNDKLTSEQQFFNYKTLEFAKELYDQNEDKLNEAYVRQKDNRDRLLNKIAQIMLSYHISDNIMSLSSSEKSNLLSQLSDLITGNLKSELDFEHNLTNDILHNVGKEKWDTSNYLYSLGADFKITQLNDEALERIINTKVKDKLWSDRLYDNKNQIAKLLRSEIKKFLTGETNVNQIEEVIKKKYNTNADETKRLVQDNICRVQEGANDEWQHEHNIRYVMYMATLDGKVCHLCAPYDSKVFELNKKPVEIPQHPFCRCVYVSLPDKDWKPKMRLDNETKKNINWQSYQEWNENRKDAMINNKKWLKSDFSSEKKFNKHIEKHLKEYNNISEKEYLDVARKLLAEPVGEDIEGFVSKNDFVFKYNKATNDFAIGRADGYISTLYKPVDGYDYWLDQIKKYKED